LPPSDDPGVAALHFRTVFAEARRVVHVVKVIFSCGLEGIRLTIRAHRFVEHRARLRLAGRTGDRGARQENDRAD
jgi:hypothetical protein